MTANYGQRHHRSGGTMKDTTEELELVETPPVPRLRPGRPRIPVIDRFWSQITKTDTCWNIYGRRYGKIKTGPPEKRTISAHRFSWEIHFGPVPDGLLVLHRCNNKLCVRPDHLYLGTQKDNVADAIRDGVRRTWKGAANPHSRARRELCHATS